MKGVPITYSQWVSAPLTAPLLHGYRAATAKAGGLLGYSSSYLLHREKNGNAFEAGDRLAPPRIAIVDGPYDAAALSNVLAQEPINLGSATCAVRPNSACGHGTFILGLLGARTDAPIPGRCPDCDLVHISLFADEDAAQTGVTDLARAINDAVASGASLINLSLAISGDDGRSDDGLAIALDRAEAAGAVVMAAAGNQGRFTASQILSHPVTIPVVAVDAAGNLLPDCNFGPLISRKGVAALGHQLRGYAPDGGTTVMSGTSVATAVATGIVARVWSVRPKAAGDSIRAALTGLRRPEGPAPPKLGTDVLTVKLDQILASGTAAVPIAPQAGGSSRLILQGGSAMNDGSEPQRIFRSAAAAPDLASRYTVAPAQGSSGCMCGGASNGTCTCSNGGTSLFRFVYVMGTVDCNFPDQSMSEEFQAAAHTIGVNKGDEASMKQRDDEPLRSWIHRVLSDDQAKSGLRYIARQMCWVLTVEKQPAYYLTLRDWQDLDDLIACLGEPDEREGFDLIQVAGSSSLVPIEASPGVALPVLQVEQVCIYKLDEFVSWCQVPLPTTPPPKTRRRGAAHPDRTPTPPEELFSSLFRRIVQTADNFGDSDEQRALNFLAVRYQPLYTLYAQKVGSEEYLLDSVRVVPSRLWRDRRIVDPVFSFLKRDTSALEKYYVRVDITRLFPFILNPLQIEKRSGEFVPNYFDR